MIKENKSYKINRINTYVNYDYIEEYNKIKKLYFYKIHSYKKIKSMDKLIWKFSAISLTNKIILKKK